MASNNVALGLSSDLCKRLGFLLASEFHRRRRIAGPLVNVPEFLLRNSHAPSLRRRPSVRWESGNPAFGFPLFHGTPRSSASSPSCTRIKQPSALWKCGNLAVFARFPRRHGNGGKHAVRFHRFHPPAFPQRSVQAATIYIISVWGTRSPSRIAKRCKAAFQFCTGMVHFFAMCSRARYSSFIAAS
jgi:hypothetical protein